jgi:hypothetical protein
VGQDLVPQEIAEPLVSRQDLVAHDRGDLFPCLGRAVDRQHRW